MESAGARQGGVGEPDARRSHGDGFAYEPGGGDPDVPHSAGCVRTAAGFTCAARPAATLGAGQACIRLSEALLREPCEPLGAEPVTVDPTPSAPVAAAATHRPDRLTAVAFSDGANGSETKDQSGRVLRLRPRPGRLPRLRRAPGPSGRRAEQAGGRAGRATGGEAHQGPHLGFMGEPRVSVLQLRTDLKALAGSRWLR
ncbi:hypothetical protein GCM10010347_31400 [Streptomyces cirratus]|uniref:Uncharacterized protein n=1 Tax=Streptomyces cirratus TaxID=68187 RepID=A0ABQ3ETI6_9ACTN|nr:hypothetical protein GCM10010347_31400 [Streptomyces cirratus]